MKDYEIVQIFALIFWSFQLAPQAVQNHQKRSTQGLSSLLMLCWSIGSLLTGIYSIGAEFSILFIIQPNLFLVFSILCWAQCHYYESKKPLFGVIYGLFIVIAFAAAEVFSGLALKQIDVSTGDWRFVLIGEFVTIGQSIFYILHCCVLYP